MKTVVFFIYSILLIASCNPVRFATKQQLKTDKIIKDYLAVHPPRIDTNTVYIKGNTDTVWEEVISYTPTPQDYITDVPATPNTVVKYLPGATQKIYIYQTDTIVKTITNTDALKALSDKLIQAQAKEQSVKDRATIDRYTTYALFALLALLLFLYIKKLLK